MKRTTGQYERTIAGDEAVQAFIPSALPPQDPEIKIDGQLAERLRTAEHALARLDLASEMVPSLDWFIYAFVRKEAVISSQIEGTQATLIDLLNFEAEHEVEPDADVEEICNHLDALSYARKELAKSDGLPLSMRLLNGAHQRLMHGARGATKQPGEVRRSQNWIGGSRPGNAIYVPPPVKALPSLLGDFEKYLHTTDNLPPLVRVGLAHVQFESIHPYLDGNGRLGRLLIALLLEHWGLLKAPLLYLSLFFKRHRAEYFRRLTAVRTEGDWEGWTDFFLDAVATIADEAVTSARELFAVVTSDRARVLAQDTTSVSAVRLFELLPNHPIITVATAMTLIETSKPTATRAVETLIAAGILVETTGKKRDRSFAYQTYVDRLRIGTELEHR
ncbi:Fic family protein [Rhizobium mongolense]|uniref:Fic family protein n=2 Tax=Rhizobium mongolense TaxID=57676 RepID=A0ABR6IZM0_9HYPH|nr:Fic family protein [Rhizobium mongolense]MBB4233381.1 Fic family protein [Rhizobium mongolense]TVZ74762.1 Fic family protein [Rhizobium mongolense USDA 1844]